jgi:hypothetical protein
MTVTRSAYVPASMICITSASYTRIPQFSVDAQLQAAAILASARCCYVHFRIERHSVRV